MEDNIQTIVIAVISVFLLFIFPVYMAYEKKDDISYALAMRYTQDLVDEVRSKGYITKYMYDDYRAKLKVTGNSYDINMTHEYNRYDPITNYYTIDVNGKYTLAKTTTQEEKKLLVNQGIAEGLLTDESTNSEQNKYIAILLQEEFKTTADKIRIEDTYQISKQIYTTEYIESIIRSEKKLAPNSSGDQVNCDDINSNAGCQYAYIMNLDDNFNVTIKNTNTTLATVIYNMVTANTLDENTRIYVNYGGAILATKWYGDIDYAKMDHEKIQIAKLKVIQEFIDEQYYAKNKGNGNVINKFTTPYDGEYAIGFDVKPTNVTVLKQKGNNNTGDYPVQNYTGYNFAIGNNQSLASGSRLSISVGINGISLIVDNSIRYGASTNKSFTNFPYEIPYTTSTGCTDGAVLCTKYAQTDIEAYSKLRLRCTEKGSVKVTLQSNQSVLNNVSGEINVNDEHGILVGLDVVITNPTPKSITKEINGSLCIIDIQSRRISISASKVDASEKTILSYPAKIDKYTNVRLEIKEKEEKVGIYTALLYLNGERVDESIEMNYIPKVNVVGMSTIGNDQPRYFDGNIKNVKLYSKMK